MSYRAKLNLNLNEILNCDKNNALIKVNNSMICDRP